MKYLYICLLLCVTFSSHAQVNPNRCKDFYLGCVSYYIEENPKLADSLFHFAMNDDELDTDFSSFSTMNFARIKAALGDTSKAVSFIRKAVMQGYPLEWVTEKKFPILKGKLKTMPLDSLSRYFYNIIDIKAYKSALELDNIFNFNVRILYQDSNLATKNQMPKIDSIRFEKLKHHIDTYGFPKDKQIGTMAVGNLIQYMEQLAVTYEPAWTYIEKLFIEVLNKGNLEPYYYARLCDHRSNLLDEKGKYGTHYQKPRKGIKGNKPYEFPLRDPTTVDKDRAALGIVPIYIRIYGAFSAESKLPNGYSFDEPTFRKRIFEQCL